jgi:NADH dehydrogenase FAD-containing subunit
VQQYAASIAPGTTPWPVHSWYAVHVQVAKQQGQYLAQLVSAGIAPGRVPEGVAPFKYNHKGSLAYVGAHVVASLAACTAVLPAETFEQESMPIPFV